MYISDLFFESALPSQLDRWWRGGTGRKLATCLIPFLHTNVLNSSLVKDEPLSMTISLVPRLLQRKTGREPGRFDHVPRDVACVVLIIELAPTQSHFTARTRSRVHRVAMLRHWTATRSTALDAAHWKSCILPMTTLATDWHCSLATVQFASICTCILQLASFHGPVRCMAESWERG